MREALDYGLACSETAFVMVRQEAGKPIEGTVAVANALPSGWSAAFDTGRYRGAAGGAVARAMVVGMNPMQAPMPHALRHRRPIRLRHRLPDMRNRLRPLPNAPGRVASYATWCPVWGRVSRTIRQTSLFHGRAFRDHSPQSEQEEAPIQTPSRPSLYTGVPQFTGSEAVLFDSQREAGQIPEGITFTRLELHFPNGNGPLRSIPA